MSTDKRRSCKHKRAHKTREEANAALASVIRNRHASPYYMHVYKCRHCGAWHVGHKLGYGGRRR